MNRKMKNIVIIGAGGHAAEIDEYINYSQNITGKKELNIIGFLDDDPESYTRYRLSAPFQGGIKDHQIRRDVNYIIGIANLKYRKIIVDRFKAEGANFVTFIHCNSYISESATIGNGVVIGPNVNIGPNVRIGDFNLLNARSSMGHDTIVGDFNFISPNVCFSGFTTVGDKNLFGINSATIPGIKVGNCNKIAAGMVLDKNVGDGSVVFYRYKERVIAIPK
ncbi:MAG: acetyltransferase [Proteobacteria bacterium]|nr:acetyltransferase [Pseudomonadota bacterium]